MRYTHWGRIQLVGLSSLSRIRSRSTAPSGGSQPAPQRPERIQVRGVATGPSKAGAGFRHCSFGVGRNSAIRRIPVTAAAAAAAAGGFRDVAAEARWKTGACRAGLTAACAAAAAQVAAVQPARRRQSRRHLRRRRRRAPVDHCRAIWLCHPVDLPWRLRARRRRWPVRKQPPEPQNQRIQGLRPLGCGAAAAARRKAGAGRAGLAAASAVAAAAAGAAAGPAGAPAPALRRACQALSLGRAWAGASGRPAPLSRLHLHIRVRVG
jgi:hypothetical protein